MIDSPTLAYGARLSSFAIPVKVENRAWKVDAGSRTIDLELTTLSSTNHVELTPSDAGFQDRYIVQEIIKEMAKNRPIDTKGKKGYKVLVLNEVDKLSREAQHSLRRTMEKYRLYSSSCRLILCCNSSSKVTDAIKSRCLNVRINAPSQEEECSSLFPDSESVGFRCKERKHATTPTVLLSVLPRNRIAVLEELYCLSRLAVSKNNQVIYPMDWEEYVSEIGTGVMKEQSPKSLFQVHGSLYFFKKVLRELLRKLDSELKLEVCHWAAYYSFELMAFLMIYLMSLLTGTSNEIRSESHISHRSVCGEVYEHIQKLSHLNLWLEKEGLKNQEEEREDKACTVLSMQ
ncbi:unnamed protein product [Cochlearia groenlandica]